MKRQPPKVIRCRLCGARFIGAGAIGRLSHHRKVKHPGTKLRRRKKKGSSGVRNPSRVKSEQSPRRIIIEFE